MSVLRGRAAHAASPSQEDNRIFDTQSKANAYLITPNAKAGQGVKIKDIATNKYKAYIIQGSVGNFEYKPMGAGDYIGNALPSVADGDVDTNYFIYDSEEGIYKHHRFNGTTYVLVSGNSYSKTDMNEMLKEYGVSIELNGNEISLLNEDGDALGDTVTIPTQGLTNIKAQVVNEIEDGETVAYLEIYDNQEATGDPITRCKLPAGTGTASDGYSVRLYNRIGKSTTFTTSANGTTNVTISFHENDPDGVQTSQSGNISVYYKDSEETDSAYRLLRAMTIPQDTNTDIDVTRLLAAGKTTNVRVTAYTEIRDHNLPPTSGYGYYANQYLVAVQLTYDGSDIDDTPYSIGTAHRTTLGHSLPITSLSYGVHYLKYYFTTDEGAISNILTNVIFYNDSSSLNPMIGLDKSVLS